MPCEKLLSSAVDIVKQKHYSLSNLMAIFQVNLG